MNSTFGTYSRDMLAATLVVAGVIFIQSWFMGIALVFLDVLLIVALLIWAIHTKEIINLNMGRFYFLAVGIQCFHFLEEFLTGFHLKFPQFFGYQWSDQQFVILNATWLGMFVFNGAWLSSEVRLSYLLVYFITIASITNGIAHPLLAFYEGGYFPGLMTSPFSLVIGLILWKKIRKR